MVAVASLAGVVVSIQGLMEYATCTSPDSEWMPPKVMLVLGVFNATKVVNYVNKTKKYL